MSYFIPFPGRENWGPKKGKGFLEFSAWHMSQEERELEPSLHHLRSHELLRRRDAQFLVCHCPGIVLQSGGVMVERETTWLVNLCGPETSSWRRRNPCWAREVRPRDGSWEAAGCPDHSIWPLWKCSVPSCTSMHHLNLGLLRLPWEESTANVLGSFQLLPSGLFKFRCDL